VLVSAFAFGGIPEKAIRRAFAETDIYVSLSILKEYREVPLILEDENKLTQAQRSQFVTMLEIGS
jgi:predicted nucleic acid-binding protein